jgi:hypothetical protein
MRKPLSAKGSLALAGVIQFVEYSIESEKGKPAKNCDPASIYRGFKYVAAP